MAQTLENRTSTGWSPLAMPKQQPKHVWQPPAVRPSRDPQPRTRPAAPSAGNARARRARRNGWSRTP